MDSPAIEKWLIDEFSKRFQAKIGEYLTTLIWFDPDRYWLPSIPWLADRSANWTFSLEEGRKVPMTLVAVGSDIPDGKGQSPLKIRLSILKDRILNADQNGSLHFQQISSWIIYCPYPPDSLNEATRTKKTIPLSHGSCLFARRAWNGVEEEATKTNCLPFCVPTAWISPKIRSN